MNGRFIIQNKIAEGSFGSVYNCIDDSDIGMNLVIKISQNQDTAENEVQAISKIN